MNKTMCHVDNKCICSERIGRFVQGQIIVLSVNTIAYKNNYFYIKCTLKIIYLLIFMYVEEGGIKDEFGEKLSTIEYLG